jgi:hypothetical protein
VDQLPSVEKVAVSVKPVDERAVVRASDRGDLPRGDETRMYCLKVPQFPGGAEIYLPVFVRRPLELPDGPIMRSFQIFLREQVPTPVVPSTAFQGYQGVNAAASRADGFTVAEGALMDLRRMAAAAFEYFPADWEFPYLMTLPAEHPLDLFVSVVGKLEVRMDLEPGSASGALAGFDPEVVEDIGLRAVR